LARRIDAIIAAVHVVRQRQNFEAVVTAGKHLCIEKLAPAGMEASRKSSLRGTLACTSILNRPAACKR
jgi:hypothetical protein